MQFTNKSVGSLWWSRHFEVGSDKERAREEARVSLSRAPFFLAPTNSKRLPHSLNKTWVTKAKQTQYGGKYGGRFHSKKDTPPNLLCLEMLL